MKRVAGGLSPLAQAWPAFKVLRNRDFRILWTGAFLSFFGSQLQNVAQGHYVWQLTRDNDLSSFVGVAAMLPGTLLFPFVGFLVDLYDRKVVMTVCMVVLGAGAAFLGYGVQTGTVLYVHFVIVSVLSGLFSTVEMPTRQSIVRDVVPHEDLGAAVPLQAMAFNLSRVVGPAVGGLLISFFSPVVCFYLNAISFAALIYAPWAMKADLKPLKRDPAPLMDLIFEGVRYTFRHKSLRRHFLLEGATSFFSVYCLSQLPAYVDLILHKGKQELGFAQSAVGIGAVAGLVILLAFSDKPLKPLVIRVAMTLVSAALVCLSLVHVPWMAYCALAVAGTGMIVHFNATNALFQMTAPVRLKGRVLTMHFWALSGLAPVGLLAFGHVAELHGVKSALVLSGGALGLFALWSWTAGFEKSDPQPDQTYDGAA